MLQHLILSHQGRPEWATAVVPKFPEALILHYADDLDAKMNIMRRAISSDTTDEEFTPWHRILERRIFKKRRHLEVSENELERE